MPLILGLIWSLTSLPFQAPSRDDVAAYYAPLVYQATGVYPKGDALTRVDFDGNTDASDNWEALPSHPTPSHVYSSVIETATHYYLTYGFFHPRDYARVCFPVICHENDFEGAIFMVRKGGPAQPFGTLVLVQTIAHLGVHVERTPSTVADPVDGHPRVALYIEAEGHGVHTLQTQHLDPARLFEYRPDTVADVACDGSTCPAAGTFRYSLLSIERELWDRRDLVGSHGLFARHAGFRGSRFAIAGIPLEFNGDNFFGLSKPQAPWGWRGPHGLQAGEIFVDPAYAATRQGVDRATSSLEYLYNAFLGIARS